MKQAKPDWAAIKNEYITTPIMMRELAKKHGVNYNTLHNRCTRGGWTELRNKYRQTYGELAKVDWEAIKKEYITTSVTAAALAAKHDIDAREIFKRRTKEGWVELRRQYCDSVKPENLNVSVPGCLMGYCEKRRSRNECQRCGFNAAEARRRKQIPLTVGKNGLRRKVVRMEV